jgi:hypothetical protein
VDPAGAFDAEAIGSTTHGAPFEVLAAPHSGQPARPGRARQTDPADPGSIASTALMGAHGPFSTKAAKGTAASSPALGLTLGVPGATRSHDLALRRRAFNARCSHSVVDPVAQQGRLHVGSQTISLEGSAQWHRERARDRRPLPARSIHAGRIVVVRCGSTLAVRRPPSVRFDTAPRIVDSGVTHPPRVEGDSTPLP